ncbi:MAG: hypothetical protein EOP85_04495 [Verrucomicrobiaceae bacterium]|nr:MAG: hypothetical protein EOP85_04495 [Verrucomicrobiaceae bacterium]
MRFFQPIQWSLILSRLSCAALVLVPSLLMAHPGHYHPDETDEFDFFKANFFHSHGAMDYLLGAVALSCLVLSCVHGRRSIRIAAFVAALGSIALLPVL